MISAEHLVALGVVADRLAGLREPWLISGSVAAALHGAAMTPGDVDVESTAAGAYAIGERLAEFAERPVEFSTAGIVRSHFGVFRVHGVAVEVMGDLQVYQDGSWCAPFSTLTGRITASTPVGSLPVADRAALSAQYDRFGYTDRAEMVRGTETR